MTKLSIDLVQKRMLAEDEAKKASFERMSAPDKKSRKIGTPKDPSSKVTRITQVEVPTSHRDGGRKSSSSKAAPGIPAADYAGKIVDAQGGVPSWSTAKNEKSPATPSVERKKPNQTSKMKSVSGAIKRTEQGNTYKSAIPQAEMAGNYTRRMAHGNTNLNHGSDKTPTVSADKAKNLNGTTSPARKPAKMTTRQVDTQKVSQVSHGGKMASNPSDAPAKPTWKSAAKGHNVMESVQIVLNGKTKASFDVVSKDVVRKMVETYRSHGYNVDVRRGKVPAWKSDEKLIKTIFESVDASYNNAPMSSRKLRKQALNMFFSANAAGFNSMYESRQEYAQTLLTAFNRIMEKADLRYRRGLSVMEGLARIEADGEVIDLELVTQARDANMALRQFRDEIVENYGFGTKIKHIFIDGEKKTTRDIIEWSERNR